MKKELFKAEDVIFIGKESFKILYITDEYYGICNEKYQNDVPKSFEKLMSFTPYHFEGDYLVGFTQERPWQPQHGELVWVWDNGDQYLAFGIFTKMDKDKYTIATSIESSTKTLSGEGVWDFCKPYKGNEINYDKVFK